MSSEWRLKQFISFIEYFEILLTTAINCGLTKRYIQNFGLH